MKKNLIFLIVFTLMSSVSYAAFIPDSQESVSTSKAVFNMRDKTFVTVVGNVIKQVGDEKYLFKDKSGQIVVEIDDELLLNITVTPQTKVKITGEVDRDFHSVVLEASKIELVQ